MPVVDPGHVRVRVGHLVVRADTCADQAVSPADPRLAINCLSCTIHLFCVCLRAAAAELRSSPAADVPKPTQPAVVPASTKSMCAPSPVSVQVSVTLPSGDVNVPPCARSAMTSSSSSGRSRPTAGRAPMAARGTPGSHTLKLTTAWRWQAGAPAPR